MKWFKVTGVENIAYWSNSWALYCTCINGQKCGFILSNFCCRLESRTCPDGQVVKAGAMCSRAWRAYHILSLFNTVSCNWNALGPAFLQSLDSVVEESLMLHFQLAIYRAGNSFVSKVACFHEFHQFRSENWNLSDTNHTYLLIYLHYMRVNGKEFMKGRQIADEEDVICTANGCNCKG